MGIIMLLAPINYNQEYFDLTLINEKGVVILVTSDLYVVISLLKIDPFERFI